METKTEVGHTPTPWEWQKFGEDYNLTAQHGMREIIIGVIDKNRFDVNYASHPEVAMNKNGILQSINPEHPNAAFIVKAVNSHDELLEALKAVGRPETEYDGKMIEICPWCGAQDDNDCKEDCQGQQAIQKANGN